MTKIDYKISYIRNFALIERNSNKQSSTAKANGY